MTNLVRLGADHTLFDSSGSTALDWATRNKKKKVIDYLQSLESGSSGDQSITTNKKTEMDKNLKLAIIGELIENGKLVFDIEEFTADDENYDEYEPYAPVEKYFHELDLKKYDLDSVDYLGIAPYGEGINAVWNQYDGEDDYFDVDSLDGIEICKNIKEVTFECFKGNDLAPLGKLKKLERITISSGEIIVKSYKPLLELLNLKEIVFNQVECNNEKETQEVIKILKNRGVKMKIQ
ncbi:MAG: hypothetical protein MJB14_12140 [Spirochaetes bacterium]|nr:hypothetical protein [Spirochaetota bacterium]